MKSLEPQRADWEKQILAAYEAGDLAWRVQRPTSREIGQRRRAHHL